VAWDSHSGYGYSNSPGKVTVTAAKYEAKSADFARLLMGRTYTPGGAADHSIMRDLMSKPSNLFGGANPLPAALERKVGVKAVARGAMRMVPIVGTAMMIKDAIDLVESTGCKLDLDEAKWVCPAEVREVIEPSGVYKYALSGSTEWFADLGGVLAYWQSRWSGVSPQGCGHAVALTAKGEWVGDNRTYGRAYTSFTQWDTRPYIGYGCYAVSPLPVLGDITIVRSTAPQLVKKCLGYWNASTGMCVEDSSENDIVDKIPPDNASNAARAPGVLEWMDQNGGQYDTENPRIVDLPPSISGGRYETTNNPDGSTTTKDRDYILRTSPSPSPAPTIIVDIRDTVTTWPSGTTPDPAPEPGTRAAPPVTAPAGGSQGSTTTSNGGGSGETVVEVKSCGLPDTPPCKIDESGTPEWDAKDGSADAGGIFAALGACLADIASCVPALPDLSWSFSLPSSCAAIPTPGFEPFLSEVNICPYQPTIHDLMSMVWAAAGLFAGIAMVGRDARASI
jgi:hypothetical protein